MTLKTILSKFVGHSQRGVLREMYSFKQGYKKKKNKLKIHRRKNNNKNKSGNQ